jgi:hypothetical protein
MRTPSGLKTQPKQPKVHVQVKMMVSGKVRGRDRAACPSFAGAANCIGCFGCCHVLPLSSEKKIASDEVSSVGGVNGGCL